MDEELRRAFALMANGDMGGTRTEAARFGVAVFNDDVPLRYDSNYLLVDELPNAVAADDLARDAERFDRAAVMVRHHRTGERLAPGFGRLGWTLHRGLVMVDRGRPERAAGLRGEAAEVAEVGEAALRPMRRARLAEEHGMTPEVMTQLLDAKLAIATRVRARFFGVVVDGQAVASTDLYDDGRTAQIEDVATLPAYRGRGYASALVTRALGQARADGCDLVFLVADAQDWPKELYRRLGFEGVGQYLKFIRPG